MDKRPILNENISVIDFKDFYWLKEELVLFCRTVGLISSGSKLEIAGRIEKYLTSGIKNTPRSKPKTTSKFDWNNEILLSQTLITDNYKNTENVRSFFEKNIGQQFKFNVKFMDWMKSSEGKTLGQAIKEWEKIKVEKIINKRKKISPQFEYNTYLRDFLADNPGSKRDLGIKLWKIKKSMRGDNLYNKNDLNFIVEK